MTEQLVKQKLNQLVNDLNEILSKKWPIVSNNGLDIINKINKLFSKIYQNESEPSTAGTVIDTIQINDDINDVNRLFSNLTAILNNFNQNLSNLKQILDNIQTIYKLYAQKSNDLGFDLDKIRFLMENDDLTRLYQNYKAELELKTSLIQDYLFKLRFNQNNELLVLTAYWMHEPHIDEILNSKFKYLIKLFQ